MRRLVLSFMLLAAISIPAATAVSPTEAGMPFRSSTGTGQVNWLTLAEGLRVAKSTGKPILVDVSTDWCGFCKKLDRETLSAPPVAAFLSSNFVSVKVNAEDGSEGQQLAAKHNVRGFPTTLVLDANGTLLKSIVGFKSADKFLGLLQE
jgi:thiol:disulfide interchange protein